MSECLPDVSTVTSHGMNKVLKFCMQKFIHLASKGLLLGPPYVPAGK